MLYMRSVAAAEDRTARAVIRDEALRLFGERGADVVTVRQIAEAAGVSPGLVLHHFGSKDGLRQEVDRFVLEVFEGMLGELAGEGGAELVDPGASSGLLSEVFGRYLPDGSPLPGYLRRLLLGDSEAGRKLFQRLFQLSREALDGLVAAGVAVPGRDADVRAAFLLANDLAVFLLRDRLADVLGSDPLSADGMARWGAEMLGVYAGGLGAPPPEGSAEQP
jgi:AcrR family transcriptional regulator